MMGDLKSNKFDTEQVMKGVDIIHKQLTHIIVLTIEIVKLLFSSNMESEKSKNQKKSFVLKSAVNVCQWIHKFDPQNINNDDLYLPPDLKQLSDYSKQLIEDFPKLDLAAENAYKKHKMREHNQT